MVARNIQNMPTNRSISGPISNLPSEETLHPRRKYLAAIPLASAALMVAWSFAVPVFEGPDEPAHWQYANYLHQNRALPLYGPSFPEANSPPLYYLLIAPLAVERRIASHWLCGTKNMARDSYALPAEVISK